jgi:zinc transport system substrate-binding protein
MQIVSYAVSASTRVGLTLAALPVLLVSCKRNEPASAAKTGNGEEVPVICVTTYPMQYFAERIGRGKVLVFCPVPGDQAALLREISADMIRAYQDADLVVINGAGYENWIEMVLLAESRIVDTSKPFEKDLIVVRNAVAHSHGPASAHSHEGIDGHTWLDPVLAKIQAEEIKKAMIKHFPAHAAEFEEGFSSLARDLEDLDRLLADVSRQHDGRPILASHPTYGYLARRYKWTVVDLEPGLDPTRMPDDATIEGIRRALKTHPAEYILWETRPRDDVARGLARELGLKGVVFSPCKELGEEDRRSGRSYVKIMRENVANIRNILAEGR